MSAEGKLHFWLREEVKPGERRTPILPEHAQQLINAGHTVTVEESRTRCVSNEEYKKIGCKLVPSGSWVHSPRDTVILGLKDLPDDNSNIKHRHIFFAHAYKNQTGWKELLSRFIRGEGFVWDLEYLTEENGRRVAAFGRCAGYIGMATGVLMWCHQILHPEQPKLPSLEYHENFEALVKYCKPLIDQASAKIGRRPRVLVIGALGRCGGGAVSCANDLGIESTKWDINETAGGGPFPEALEHDILLNAIYLFQKIPPFLTTEFIQKPRKLSVVVDVSCDPNNPANPLPIYSDCTTLFDPNVRIVEGSTPLDVVAIDHLPSLVPFDSSKEFADALIKHLCQTGQTDVWNRAKQIYVDKTRPIIAELNEASKHVWLRDEVVDGEKRTALTPADSKKLIADHSFKVTVERSNSREFHDEEYEKAGCELVEAGSWKSAPMNATILGLQGLPNEDQTPIKHRHMYFGYAFKEQAGWKELLSRFAEGGGSLLDLEYLTDSTGNRLTTFAKVSGYIGMAISILVWVHQQTHPKRAESPRKRSNSQEAINALTTADNIDKSIPLLEYIQGHLAKAVRITGRPPVPIVIGGQGRVGSGAVMFAKMLGLQPAVVTRANMKSLTAASGGRGCPSLLNYDILINAIKLDGQTSPFLTTDLISESRDRQLTVVVDMSCDVYNPNNPLPIYNSPTTFETPTLRVVEDPVMPLDVVAIEKLSGILPREASVDFSSQLFPHLLHLGDPEYEVFKRALNVFKSKSNGLNISAAAAPTLHLPQDFPRVTAPSDSPVEIAHVRRDLTPELSAKLKEISRELSASRENVLLAVLKTLLYRLTGEDDLQIGIFLENSPALGNVYTIRSNLSNNPIFREVVRQIDTMSRMEEIRLSPENLDKTLEEMRTSNPPKYQVLYGPTRARMTSPTIKSAFGMFELSFVAHNGRDSSSTDEISIELYYRKDSYSEDRMNEMMVQFELLLQQVVSNPNEKLQQLSLLTSLAKQVIPDVKKLLDNTWFGSIHSHFEASAKRLPDKIALVHHEVKLTYRELNALTSKLANYLVKNGIKPEDSIFIFGQRNLSMVWAVMGILKAGGAVSLMDPVYPPERIVNCLEVAQPKAWINVAGSGPMPSLVSDYLKTIGCNVVLDLPLPAQAFSTNFLGEYEETSPNVPITEDNIAVITFTSGSTGLPKGVLGRHGPLTHFYPWMKERFGLNEEDHFTMCSGISHDPLQRDIFTPLFFGATLHIPNADDIANPGQLAKWMKSQGVTVTHLTPAMGQLLSETTDDTQVPSLRLSLLVGDKLTKRDVLRLYKVAPKITVVNMYGSTETQRAVSYYVVPPRGEKLDQIKEILPAGQGMKDVELIIMNNDNSQAGIGEIGEIYVRSPHLARGYKGLPEQTAAKFIVNPFNKDIQWDRMYRTGDLGRYKLDGTVEVTGRADNQVKIRGFRIELGEINTMLATHKSVRENVPLVREDVPGDKRIVAYVVPHAGHLLPPGHELRRFLENKLPYYMIPSAFIVMKTLPLTPNGKINMGALPAPERVQKNRIDRKEPTMSQTITLNEKSFEGFWKEMFPHLEVNGGTVKEEGPTFTPKEQEIAKIWADLLGTNVFGPEDNFFDLGGHSLMATALISRLRKSQDLEKIPIDILLKNPTVKFLTAALEKFKEDPNSANASGTIDLEAEAQLDPAIRPPAGSNFSGEIKNVLLTGATGFLGVFILRELLDQTKATIWCLVRASTRIDGRERIVQNLKLHKLWNDSYDQRIVPLPGDLTRERFGLNTEQYGQLSESIDCIINNAALVHWIFPYEQLKPHNVTGTLECLRLATTKKLKAMHHVSTTSVFDSDRYRSMSLDDKVLESDDLSSWRGLSGGYPTTKWVAERLVMEARSRGVPANIYRPGYISGDVVNGIWTTDDFLCRMLKGCVQLGKYPDLNGAKLDICTVSYVAQGIVHISQKKDLLNSSYHFTNPNPLPTDSFFSSAKNIGFDIEKSDFRTWRSTLTEQASNENGNPLNPVISVFGDNYPEGLKHAPYDSSLTRKVLKEAGIELPSIESLMPLYYSYFIRSGFLQSPKNLNKEYADQYLSKGGVADLVTRTSRTTGTN